MKRADGESERQPSKKRKGGEVWNISDLDVDYKKKCEELQQALENSKQALENSEQACKKSEQEVKALSVETALAAQPGQFDLKPQSMKTSLSNEQSRLSAKAYATKKISEPKTRTAT